MNCDVTDRTVGVLTCREGHVPDNLRVTPRGGKRKINNGEKDSEIEGKKDKHK